MMLVFVPRCPVLLLKGVTQMLFGATTQRGESNLRISLLSWDAFAYFMDGLE